MFNDVCTACNSLMHVQSNCLHIWQRSTDRSIRAMSYNLILFLEAGAPSFEVTKDTIVDKQIQHTATHLNTLASSPVKIDALNRELKFYYPNEATFLLNGSIKGFLLYYAGPRIPSESKNLKLALIWPEIVHSELPRPILQNSVESDHGCTSGIYFDNEGDNVTLTLYSVTLTSQ